METTSSETDKIKQQFLADLDSGAPLVPTAIRILTQTIKDSKAETIMGLEHELRQAASIIQSCLGFTSISLQAGCDFFFSYLTKISLDQPDFEECKRNIIQTQEHYVETTHLARERIAKTGERFIRDGSTVLTHGNSRVVQGVLQRAATSNPPKKFNVIVTEGRPSGEGYCVATELKKLGINSTTVVLDAAVGAIMEKVDLVLVGAEAIVENGGAINKIGSLQLALAAKYFHKPFYVAVESYKFARLYPLKQFDLFSYSQDSIDKPWTPLLPDIQLSDDVKFLSLKRDFTPASHITLLLTDLGILTPAAVSDELIRLYQNF